MEDQLITTTDNAYDPNLRQPPLTEGNNYAPVEAQYTPQITVSEG